MVCPATSDDAYQLSSSYPKPREPVHVSDFEFGRFVYGLLFNPEKQHRTPSNLQMAVTGSQEVRTQSVTYGVWQ